MKTLLAAFALLIASAFSAAAKDAPYVGSWDCQVGTFTFTNDTYDSGGGPIPIEKVEMEDGNYILTMPDNYQIALSSVTSTSMQWLSYASSDMFDCKKLKSTPVSSSTAENRCGWLQNPTPGNWWLDDADASWTMMTQGGGYEPEGMDIIPDISEGDYVRTNGNYGYACACMEVETDADEERITRILSFRQLSISKCENDNNLDDPE
jgi:hypothetical protein